MCDECAKSNKGMMGKVFFAVLVFVGVLAVISAREADQGIVEYGERPDARKQVMREAQEQEVPTTLGGLERREVIRGAKALAEVAQLHGKMLTELTDATVVQYGAGEEQAVVWVGLAPSTEAAQRLIQGMSEAIGRGESPFSGITLSTEKGIPVYHLFGMGQRHIYFAAGKKVIWVAADSERIERISKDVVTEYAAVGEKAI